jgi:hypothetical protein
MAIIVAVSKAAIGLGQTRLVFTARPFVDVGTDRADRHRPSPQIDG